MVIPFTLLPIKNELTSTMQSNMTAEQAFEPFSAIAPYPFDDFKDSAHSDSRPLTLVRSIALTLGGRLCVLLRTSERK